MKTILLFLMLLISANLFSQETYTAYFSIGISYDKKIETKLVRYLDKNKDKMELIFICPEQKIYVIRTKLNTVELFKKLGIRFASTQFVFKEEKHITEPSCIEEYKKIKATIK